MKRAWGRPVFRLGVVGGVALTLAGSAYAYVCHPDLRGTLRLPVDGRVDGYSMHGPRVTIDVWADGCEHQVVWKPLARSSSRGGCADGLPEDRARRSARDGRLRVTLRAGNAGEDQPDRLAVFDARTGDALHAWPLPARASTVDVARGVAVLSTSNGVYAVRLKDGQNALVGVKRRGDYPQIEPPGIVFQDDLYKRSGGPALLKFIPFSTVSNALRPSGPLRVPTTIGDFAMDGRSVIFVKRDPSGQCDHIGLWSIPWHYSTDLMDEPPICPEKHAPGGITALAIGGQYVEVVTTYGKVRTLISSTIVRCIEKVVTRSRLGRGAVRALSADGPIMAYGTSGRIGFLSGQNVAGTAGSPAAPVQLSADGRSLAVLRADGQVDVRNAAGLLGTFPAAGVRAIALRADKLVMLRRGFLDVYDLSSELRLHRWRVPAGTAPAVDVHFGVALLTAGRNVIATKLDTGRTAVLFRAPTPVRAHLDDVGAVYRYNVGRGGVLGFIPFARVEQKLGA
jgi:hypothetical protein